jgi:competence protein ComFC
MSMQRDGMTSRKRGIWRLLLEELQRIETLLQAKGHSCLACRGRSDSNVELLGLCQPCYSRLAWIKDVQCPFCGRYEACPDCVRRLHTKLRCSRSAVRYNEAMKALLAQYKYRGDEKLKSLLGSMLIYAYGLLELSIQSLNKQDGAKVITYVPLSEERYRERGFNQAEQMARELGSALNVPVIPLLKRVRHTEKQSFKTRRDRLDDLIAVFDIDLRAAASLVGSFVDIIIIDDVYTTGSTLHQCADVIYKHVPAAIYGLTWAR